MQDTVRPGLVCFGQRSLMCRQTEVTPALCQTSDFAARLAELADCMNFYGGIGIAAPQIGWNARVFCFGVEASPERYPALEAIPFEFWINPWIVELSAATNWAWEGCLSVPGMRGWVERPVQVRLVGLDEHGVTKQRAYDGYASRVVQHEYDHLDGMLFPMRVQNPKYLLPEAIFAERATWLADWPSRAAHETALGTLSALA